MITAPDTRAKRPVRTAPAAPVTGSTRDRQHAWPASARGLAAPVAWRVPVRWTPHLLRVLL